MDLLTCCVVGTRPEAIKMAPVIMELRKECGVHPYVLATGQHAEMLRQSLSFFQILPDADLAIMKDRQSLDYITASVLSGVGEVLDKVRPDLVLVHGDTSTTFASALAAFYRRIPVGHVEAGLRSGNLYLPFPEEANRLLVDRISTLLFAPTEWAKDNLLAEGYDAFKIWVTGNTVIDALLWGIERVKSPSLPELKQIPESDRILLLTAHRRESWGEPLYAICRALRQILAEESGLWAVIPVHKNPVVREIMAKELYGISKVILCEPLDYPDFIWAMKRSTLILSDSGGIQEEATAIKKPVLVLREVTERPEALNSGTAILVGHDTEKIVAESLRLLRSNEAYEELVEHSGYPFGTGDAAKKIVAAIKEAAQKGYLRDVLGGGIK